MAVSPASEKPTIKVVAASPAPAAPAPAEQIAGPAERQAVQAERPAAKEPVRIQKPVLADAQVRGNPATVVAASPTGDKAWVRIGDQRTVIVSKGQSVPGLGVFHGAEGKGAKFDSGYLPINP
ncbi:MULTISPECIES: hypothetical protein [unclassified Variovorax]|uniref:hypothetical protein n=1 Tax=unclassified Variovorax TaxID=663243 RepID=UPI000CBDC68C|nr:MULTISPECIES: hypothetical protein [unclassified Variovorax]PNG49979.1 hypothetical protein CHC06_05560 [Variovorax sp. B2]VTU41706.1 hypothetical protein H6P1_00030 [Variovorax sp. PBL-H6]VTU44594.1 hypothetical protein SRS16P1_00872 [Variovorax sp. SRS16]VTU44641.1 hypothetical protein E5P1_00864 [Variovorax sp. PBL-E5]